MTIQQLEYFQMSALMHSFREAAGHFYVSESTISRQISALEEELGVELFLRKKEITLSKAGILFFRKSVEVISNINEFKRTLGLHNISIADSAGGFRIACHISDNLFEFLLNLLHKASSGSMKARPAIAMVKEGTAPLAVLSGSAQIGIDSAYNLRQYRNRIETCPALKIPCKVYCREGHPLCSVDTISLQEFCEYFGEWNNMLLPGAFSKVKNVVSNQRIASSEDIVEFRLLMGRILPASDVLEWIERPNGRILLPPGNIDDVEFLKDCHYVSISGVEPSITEYLFFWTKDSPYKDEIKKFLEIHEIFG